MNSHKKIFTALLFLFLFVSTSIAQTPANAVEMDDALHANGKIYVVVIVLALVFVGIIAYLVSIDRKVSKIEKEMREKKG